MNIGKEAFEQEVKYLDDTIGVIRSKISSLGQELYDDDEKVLEFKKFIWDSKSDMDPTEMKTMMAESDLQVHLMTNKGMYLQKLFRIQNKPYFASIIFNDDNIDEEIYIGITHVEDNLNYYVHDWRSPICSLYYDHEVGNAWYKAPDGIIEGKLTRKRQYIINDAKLENLKPGSSIMINIYASNNTYCEGYKAGSKIIKVPYYNPYVNSELCKGHEEYLLCSESTNVNLSKEEFESKIKEYIASLEKEEEEPSEIEEKGFNIFDFILEYKYLFIAGASVIVVTILFVLIKRNKKEKGIL